MKTLNKLKQILRTAKKDAFFMDMLPVEKVSIEVGRVATACWSYIPPHRIVVGNNEFNAQKSENYIKSLLYHELSHSLWTERDFNIINKNLNEKNIPFRLYNLFEDARIEHCFRDKTGRKFNWQQDIEALPSLEAIYLFNSLVNNEGSYPAIIKNAIDDGIKLYLKYVDIKNGAVYDINGIEFSRNLALKLMRIAGWEAGNVFYQDKRHYRKSMAGKSKVDKAACNVSITRQKHKIKPDYLIADVQGDVINFNSDNLGSDAVTLYLKEGTADKILDCYNKAINAQNSFEIIDICADWLKDFPDDREMDTRNSNYEPSQADIREMEDTISTESISAVIGESIDGDGVNEKSKSSKSDKGIMKGDKIAFSNNLKINDFVYNKNSSEFSEPELSRLINLFKGVLKKGMVKYNSIVPSKKINIRNYSLGSDKIFKNTMNDNGKNEKIAVILDCSGSMNGEHIEAGKKLLIIMNRLAKQGLIKGSIILTNSKGQAVIDMPLYNENILKSVSANYSEGFAACVKNTSHILQKAKRVFVFTDGEIGDVPDENYNRSLGIHLWGLYVGQQDQTEELLKYFNYGISKKSLEDVIVEILKTIK